MTDFPPVNLANLLNDRIREKEEFHQAVWMYKRIVQSVQRFEAKLPDDMQAGGKLVAFQNTIFTIDKISYWNPDMLIFFGTLPDGSNVELLQHTSQLNVLLVAVKRKNPENPRRKIGFEINQGD